MGKASQAASKKKRQHPVQIFTDGCFWGNYGGYAAVFIQRRNGVNYIKKLKSSHRYGNTNHNRMELRAVLASLKKVKTGYRIDIYSDSTYVVNGCKKWLDNWLFTGRIKSVKNRDLWMEIHKEIKRHKNAGSTLNFTWIRGHVGHKYNEMADQLAQEARSSWDTLSCREATL